MNSHFQGRREVSCTLYLWSSRAKIVVSDVDGTITKSDVLGPSRLHCVILLHDSLAQRHPVAPRHPLALASSTAFVHCKLPLLVSCNSASPLATALPLFTGHLMYLVGSDWTHSGVCSLYTDIEVPSLPLSLSALRLRRSLSAMHPLRHMMLAMEKNEPRWGHTAKKNFP